MRKYAIIFTLLLFSTVAAVAERELLPEGAYGTTIHGGLKAAESRSYSLEGRQGQVLKVQVFTKGLEKGANLELRDGEGESVLGGLDRTTKIDSLNLVLPKDDKYTLVIKAGSVGCSYVLEVTLEDPSEEASTLPKKPLRPGKSVQSSAPSPGPRAERL